MSYDMIASFGFQTLGSVLQKNPNAMSDIFLKAYGVGSKLGGLSYSRKYEYEADKLGLVFMTLAGYNANLAPEFWNRMTAGKTGAPPEFLSTHPNDAHRILKIKQYLASSEYLEAIK